jgi:hypothetical protein
MSGTSVVSLWLEGREFLVVMWQALPLESVEEDYHVRFTVMAQWVRSARAVVGVDGTSPVLVSCEELLVLLESVRLVEMQRLEVPVENREQMALRVRVALVTLRLDAVLESLQVPTVRTE